MQHIYIFIDGDATQNINVHTKVYICKAGNAAISSLNFSVSSSGMSKPGVLNLFKHVAPLIYEHSARGPPTVQLLHCDNCCTCAEQK